MIRTNDDGPEDFQSGVRRVKSLIEQLANVPGQSIIQTL